MSSETRPDLRTTLYAEKKTFFGATEEGGVKALVCELVTGMSPARLRASALRRRRPGCLPQHTKRRWRGSGNSCVHMSIFIHRHARKRTLHCQVAKIPPVNLPRNRGRNVRLRPQVSLMGSPLRLCYTKTNTSSLGASYLRERKGR